MRWKRLRWGNMKIILIAAADERNSIGYGGKIPWHLPADEAYLLDTIQDGWLLTGRTSYETPQAAKIFKERADTLVLTNRRQYRVPYGQVVYSLAEAYRTALEAGAAKLYVLGGSQVYRQSMPDADEVLLTRVHGFFQGDTYFPELDPEIWQEVSRESHPSDDKNSHPYTFFHFIKR